MFSFGVDVSQPAKEVLPPPYSMADDETHKRKTDCIYFLASPLTCKKGVNCEYRHSEAARMNPQDCRYWKAGNCLNLRCSFRHMPLEEKSASAGLVPSPSAAPIALQFVATTVVPNKSKKPCYFFSQGFCAKNEKCRFMHSVPTAFRADAAKTPAVAVVGLKWQNSVRLPLVPNEIVSIDQKPPIFNGSHTSKAAISLEAISQSSKCLERLDSLEQKGAFTAVIPYEENTGSNVQDCRLYCLNLNQLKMDQRQESFDTYNSAGGFVQSVERTQVDLQGSRPTSKNSLDRSALNSDSHQNPKSLSKSTSSKHFENSLQAPPEEDLGHPCGLSSHQIDTLPKHVMDSSAFCSKITGKCKKQKKDRVVQHSSSSLHNYLKKQCNQSNVCHLHGKAEAEGQTDLVIGGCERWRFSEKEPKAVREHSTSLLMAALSKVSNMNKLLTQDTRHMGSFEGTSDKETKSFSGPKSLAQIKAEKLARRRFSLETVERHDLSDVAVVAEKEAKPAQTVNKSLVSAVSKLAEVKPKTVPLLECEGSKPLSVVFKRKRDMESGSNITKKGSAPVTADVPSVDFSRELENGQVTHDKSPCCSSMLVHVDLQPISPSPREVVHRAEAEWTDFDEAFPEGLTSDVEMADVACRDAVTNCNSDFVMDDEEDDDEDFALKLRRVFALSSD